MQRGERMLEQLDETEVVTSHRELLVVRAVFHVSVKERESNVTTTDREC